MILEPANDGACLGQLTTMARELHRTTLVQTIASRLKTPSGVINWLRSLPQSDDDGSERLQYIACDVDQRTRLFPPDPNCFERSFAALTLLEVLDPKTARMLVSIEKPLRHTGVVEARGGRWVPLDLFPRRNADAAKVAGDVLKGIHTYVGKPLVTFFLGQETGGKVADLVGGLEDKLIEQGTKKPPATRPAQRPAPTSASGARKPAPTVRTEEVKPTTGQGGWNAEEATPWARQRRDPQTRRGPRPGPRYRVPPWAYEPRPGEAEEDDDGDYFYRREDDDA